ncbi:MAG: TRAP transporter fused permease subunit, partial [Desulfobacterales bacterium]|nr:TRAP transporter fused permease subunit [Desulfobacterales bacterium]
MGKMDLIITVTGLAMAAYHLVFSQYLLQGPVEHSSTHLGFSLVLVFMGALKDSAHKYRRVFFLTAAIFSLVATGYVGVLHDELEERVWFNTPADLVIGVITILLVLEATRQAFGLLVPLFAVMVVIYPFVGRHFPEPFYTTSLSLAKTISNLSVGLSGIYGPILSISANYIFLFILFGGLLQATGATGFFLEAGKMIGNRFRGGPGLMAVAGSAAVGSITGSVAANIAITGSFTIPLMKKAGYKPAQAAAIEAAASNGGQIMPPIMGIVAFGMAGVTGIPYVKIIAMALLPAILYFFCCGVYVQLRAEQLKIPFTVTDIDVKELALSSPLFLVPITVVIVLLIRGYTVMHCGFWAIVSLIAVSLIRRKSRPSLRDFANGFTQGAITGAQIGVMCAASGLIVSTFVMSGLGVKLSAGIEA